MINYSHYNKLPYKMSNDIIIHHLLIDHRHHLWIIVYYSCLLFVKITPRHCQQSGIYLQLGTEVSFIDHFYNLHGLALVNIRVSMEVICFCTGCAHYKCPSYHKKSISHLELDFTHWDRVTHICVSNLVSIVSDNGLSPGRRQAIILTNAWILLIGPFLSKFIHFHSRKCISKCRLENGGHVVSASMC